MKGLLSLLLLIAFTITQAQKNVYDIFLFGNKIGQTVVERKDDGKGTVHFTLRSKSEANLLFTKKTSEMTFDITYLNGKLISAYTQSIKDGVTEISNIIWQGTQYLIKKGAQILHLSNPIDFSSIHLYFTEPKERTRIFSERMGEYCTFTKIAEGVYECKLANGVNNIYRYRNGVLYELEISKGASVFLRLVK
jgi:hypothetical protein